MKEISDVEMASGVMKTEPHRLGQMTKMSAGFHMEICRGYEVRILW